MAEDVVCDIVYGIVDEECKGDPLLFKRVLNRGKKSSNVVAIRRKVLSRLRTEVWQLGKFKKRDYQVCQQHEKPVAVEGHEWQPLSFPAIAHYLGGDHSAWVKMNNLIKDETQIPVLV